MARGRAAASADGVLAAGPCTAASSDIRVSSPLPWAVGCSSELVGRTCWPGVRPVRRGACHRRAAFLVATSRCPSGLPSLRGCGLPWLQLPDQESDEDKYAAMPRCSPVHSQFSQCRCSCGYLRQCACRNSSCLAWTATTWKQPECRVRSSCLHPKLAGEPLESSSLIAVWRACDLCRLHRHTVSDCGLPSPSCLTGTRRQAWNAK